MTLRGTLSACTAAAGRGVVILEIRSRQSQFGTLPSSRASPVSTTPHGIGITPSAGTVQRVVRGFR